VRLSRIIIGLAAIVSMAVAPVLPASATEYGGGNVEGYAAQSKLDNGTIVELAGKDSKAVKPATSDQLQHMFGVTVDRNQLSIRLSNDSLKNETYVAVSGTYDVLVSTQGGAIASGDYVTLSSLNGVAMKASTKESTIFGRANGSFDGTGTVLGTETLKDSSGASHAVKLGMIPVTINITRNPNIKSTKVDVPKFLERLGQQIAEKRVSPVRIYLSMAITAVSLITAIAVLYAGVRSSVISIGRNPMSKKSIFRALAEIILTALLILIVGLFAVYLLLKL